MQTVKEKRLLIGLLLAFLGLLVWCSIYLARTRMYQVDECQNFYMAKVFAAGESSKFFTTGSLFLFGPLSWLTQTRLRSDQMFAAARLIFLVGFWFNLLLLAWISSGRLLTVRSLIALAGAATLAPLWDYGFEIRHDVLILAGVLVTWWLIRAKPMGMRSYALAGAIAAASLFIAVKSVVYVLPLSFAVLLFPPPAHHRSRWQLGLAWICGALLAVVLIRIGYGSSSSWDQYFGVFRGVSKVSSDSGVGGKFGPWETLSRLLQQTPLLLALTIAGCGAAASDIIRRGRAALTWNGNLPEVLLFLGALGALIINPTPFPYNLLHLVPYAFLLAFKYGTDLWNAIHDRTNLWPLVGAILIFVHLSPFAIATIRHTDRPNFRQKKLMRLAEDMTDVKKDPVYDGIGMVLTRPSIHYQWYIHSLNIRSFIHDPAFLVRNMLASNPAAVFIPSYRTEWLPQEDRDFVSERYVPLADDFWVLGTVLPPGGGDFEIIHPGRYFIASPGESGIALSCLKDTHYSTNEMTHVQISGKLDEMALTDGPIELGTGNHKIETPPDCQAAIVWIGPHLDKMPDLPPGNHFKLFVNWY